MFYGLVMFLSSFSTNRINMTDTLHIQGDIDRYERYVQKMMKMYHPELTHYGQFHIFDLNRADKIFISDYRDRSFLGKLRCNYIKRSRLFSRKMIVVDTIVTTEEGEIIAFIYKGVMCGIPNFGLYPHLARLYAKGKIDFAFYNIIDQKNYHESVIFIKDDSIYVAESVNEEMQVLPLDSYVENTFSAFLGRQEH